MIFVDSNIVIDLIEDGAWTEWSKRTLDARRGVPLVANMVVVAEISRAFGTVDDVLVFLRELAIDLVPLTAEAAFRAGRAQVDYRLSGGRHGAILADFLIGAHAVTLGAKLVTRDKRRFATYFPELELIAPETENG
jgi:predicted nucleic acid-binding protein